jgi:Ser/Thr protein kinase RdoA (MazF antagonist)
LTSIQSYTDTPNLLKILNEQYPPGFDRVELHRDLIGYVFFASSNTKRYVLKLYRAFDSENALRAVQIIHYLKQKDYPVVAIVPTGSGSLHATVETPRGPSVAVLFEFVEGAEPDLATEITRLGRQVGRLHALMQEYPEPLIRRGKDFYVDRFITILHTLAYNPGRIDEIAAYGRDLWDRLERLPAGFCHGDLHTGNMRQAGPGRYVLFDFDAASRTRSLIDVATLCDGSDFNRFDASAYSRTMRLFERFYRGYREEREMSGAEIAALFDFIPIRHYELIATITRCQGLGELSTAFLDEQYDWLMRWKNLCYHHPV